MCKENKAKGKIIYSHPPPSSSRTSLARSHILWICPLAHPVAPPLREKTSLCFGFFAGSLSGEAKSAIEGTICHCGAAERLAVAIRISPEAQGVKNEQLSIPTLHPLMNVFPYGKTGWPVDNIDLSLRVPQDGAAIRIPPEAQGVKSEQLSISTLHPLMYVFPYGKTGWPVDNIDLSLRVPQDGAAIRSPPETQMGCGKGIYLYPPSTLLRYLRLKAKTEGCNHYFFTENKALILTHACYGVPCFPVRENIHIRGGGRV